MRRQECQDSADLPLRQSTLDIQNEPYSTNTPPEHVRCSMPVLAPRVTTQLESTFAETVCRIDDLQQRIMKRRHGIKQKQGSMHIRLAGRSSASDDYDLCFFRISEGEFLNFAKAAAFSFGFRNVEPNQDLKLQQSVPEKRANRDDNWPAHQGSSDRSSSRAAQTEDDQAASGDAGENQGRRLRCGRCLERTVGRR